MEKRTLAVSRVSSLYSGDGKNVTYTVYYKRDISPRTVHTHSLTSGIVCSWADVVGNSVQSASLWAMCISAIYVNEMVTVKRQWNEPTVEWQDPNSTAVHTITLFGRVDVCAVYVHIENHYVRIRIAMACDCHSRQFSLCAAVCSTQNSKPHINTVATHSTILKRNIFGFFVLSH